MLLPSAEEGSSTISESPLIIDTNNTTTRPQRLRRPPNRLSFNLHQAARDWTEHSNFCHDQDLVLACVADVTTACDAPGSDASIFEPAPANILQVLNIRDPAIRQA